jgi:hypothetical protein
MHDEHHDEGADARCVQRNSRSFLCSADLRPSHHTDRLCRLLGSIWSKPPSKAAFLLLNKGRRTACLPARASGRVRSLKGRCSATTTCPWVYLATPRRHCLLTRSLCCSPTGHTSAALQPRRATGKRRSRLTACCRLTTPLRASWLMSSSRCAVSASIRRDDQSCSLANHSPPADLALGVCRKGHRPPRLTLRDAARVRGQGALVCATGVGRSRSRRHQRAGSRRDQLPRDL